MEELNNVQETMEIIEDVEVIEPVEILDGVVEHSDSINAKTIAMGTAVIAGIIAGGYGLKKIWDKRKTKKTTSKVEVINVVETEIRNPDEAQDE